MTQGDKGIGSGLAAQQVFGPQAAVYPNSKVHIRDDSLESVERMVDAANGSNHYRWIIDRWELATAIWLPIRRNNSRCCWV